jgi:hypothetical protein
MTFDRAIRAMLNGKAIKRGKNKFIRIRELHHEGEIYDIIVGPSGNECPTIYTNIEALMADDWECGTYNAKTYDVTWDDIVYDGHERPIDRFEDVMKQSANNLESRLKGDN